MVYNTVRTKLLMPEYGRNVQKMVEYLVTIEDPQKRLRNAEAIIELMGTLNPHLKAIEDYKHKLWDHLHQMTDFKLEVESPYPPPTPEELYKKPEPLPYPQEDIPHRHLGKNLEGLLVKAMAEPDPERRQGYTQAIGYYMKLAYTNWHKEPVHDDMIKTELAAISEGKLQYETGGYRVHFDTRTNKPPQRNHNSRNYKGGQSNASGGGGGDRRNFRDRDMGPAQGGGSFNKNRGKYNKNKNK